jgi:glycosyltransferase involved in cell wall biosynthesis
MNIVLLHYSAPPIVGGVESVLAHHARLMAAAGHKVRILAGRGGPAGQEVEARISFLLVPLADSRHPSILALKSELDAGQIPQNFAEVEAALVDILAQNLAGADILITHNVCSLHKNLALTAAVQRITSKPGGPRLICWHHDLAWTTPRYRAELHAGYPWDLLRTDWPGATQVVVSELRRRELASLLNIPDVRIQVIPNGLDAGRFLKLEPQTAEFVQRLDLLAAKPLLLLPVRITRRKNIELALRALAALREEFHQAVLVVTGPLGPHNPANREYLAELVALRDRLGLSGAAHFLAELAEGFLPDEVITDFYRLADGLFMPSREEGFGIPILEAGLAGLPVFCADIPPLRALGGASAAYFSPDADPGQVARQIAGYFSTDPVFELRARVRGAYTWEKVYAQQIEPLLRFVLGGG